MPTLRSKTSSPRPNAVAQLTLRMTTADGRQRDIQIRARRCVIGADSGCGLRLRGPGIQDVHCLILRGARRSIVRYLGGDTLLNGHEFNESPLHSGDLLELGACSFEVLEDGRTDHDDRPMQSRSKGEAAELETPPRPERRQCADALEVAQRLEAELTSLETLRETWTQTHETSRQTVAEQVAQIQQQIDELTQDGPCQEAQSVAERLDKALASLRQQRETWSQEQGLNRRELDQQVAQLREQVEKLGQSHSDGQAQALADVVARFEELESSTSQRLAQEAENLESLRGETQQAVEELQQLQAAVSQDREGSAQLTQQWEAGRAALDQHIDELSRRLDADLAATRGLCDRLAEENSRHDYERGALGDRLQEQLAALSSSVQELQENAEQPTANNNDEDDRRTAVDGEQLSQLSKRLDQTCSSSSELGQRLEGLQEQYESLQQQFQERLPALEGRLDDELATLHERAESQAGALDDMVGKLEQLESAASARLDQGAQSLEKLQAEMQSAVENFQQLQSAVDANQDQSSQLGRQWNEGRAALDRHVDELARRLDADLAATRELCDRLAEENTRHDYERGALGDRLSEQLAALSRRLDESPQEAQLQVLEPDESKTLSAVDPGQLGRLADRVDQVCSTNSDLSQRLDGLRQTCQALEQQLEDRLPALERQLEEMDGRLTGTQEQQEQIKSHLEELRGANQEADQDSPDWDAWQQRLQELEGEVQSLSVTSQQSSEGEAAKDQQWSEFRRHYQQWQAERQAAEESFQARAEKLEQRIESLTLQWRAVQQRQKAQGDGKDADEIDARLAGLRAEREGLEAERRSHTEHLAGEVTQPLPESKTTPNSPSQPSGDEVSRTTRPKWLEELREAAVMDGPQRPGRDDDEVTAETVRREPLHESLHRDALDESSAEIQPPVDESEEVEKTQAAETVARERISDIIGDREATEQEEQHDEREDEDEADSGSDAESEEEVTFKAAREGSPITTADILKRMGASVDFEEDDEPEQPMRSEPELERQASPPEQVSQPAGHEEEESIDDYMVQLMQRLRSGPAGASSSGSGASGTSAPKTEETRTEPREHQSEATMEDAQEEVEEPAAQYVRRQAPELASDFSAMRALANESARGAISAHSKRRLATATVSKLIMVVLSLVASFVLMWLSISDGSRLLFFSSVVSMLVALIWGFQLVLLASQKAAAGDEDDEEEETSGSLFDA